MVTPPLATTIEPASAGAPASRRWLARAAFAAAAAAVVLLLAVAGLRASLGLLLIGIAGLAATLAAAWWFLTHRGAVRWLAGGVVIIVPLIVMVMYARARLVWVVVLFGLLWFAAVAAARGALRPADRSEPVEAETPPPRRPVLIMNPRSGGGKVERFQLATRARELGAEVLLLGQAGHTDVADLARRALRQGADLLGVAGGDGTQALVAGIAAEHGVPFMVISAGTRNHFALDLGLDRDDPATCLDALTDGVEIRIDLGRIGDRTFVNNASFGAYAAVVQSPAYRDDKTGTTMRLLPDLLTGQQGPRLRFRVGETVVEGPQAVLVSNNPYGSDDLAGLGRRYRMDRGVLGVISVHVRGTSDAARLVSGRHASAVRFLTGSEVVVESDKAAIPVGVDGEALSMPTPVRCTIAPAALRVRVPRRRPGVPPQPPELDWTRLRRLAVSTGRSRRG